MNDSKKRRRARKDVPKRPKTNPEDAIRFHIEEAVVHLHALTHYYSDSLSKEERRFLHQVKKNLAVVYRRHGGTLPQ